MAVFTESGITNKKSTTPLIRFMVVVLIRLWRPVTMATNTNVIRT